MALVPFPGPPGKPSPHDLDPDPDYRTEGNRILRRDSNEVERQCGKDDGGGAYAPGRYLRSSAAPDAMRATLIIR